MEHVANAGEIVVSEATAAHLPPSMVGDARDSGRLIHPRRFAVTAIEPVAARRVDDDVVAQALPLRLRSRLLAGPIDAEHRTVTVGFLRFAGTDELVARAGPQQTALALGELIACVQAEAAAEDVTFLATDVDDDGGKVILVAGAPSTQEDDEGRVLRTLSNVVRRRHAVSVRAGVHRGHVFAGEVGTAWRRTYTVMGDTVNLAARLMARAEPGQLIATPAALDRAATRFTVHALEPFKVKGKTEDIHAFTVGRVLDARRRATGTMPFTGRQTEFDTMRERLVAAGAGQGSAIRIVGATGLGKSRLVDEVARSVDPAAFLVAAGEPYATSTPYLPFRLLLRSLLGLRANATSADALRQAVAERAPGLLDALPLLGVVLAIEVPDTDQTRALDAVFRRERVVDAVVELLVQLAPPGTCLLFDDFHWFDDASRELVARVTAAAARCAWLVCVAERPGGDDVAGEEVLTLPPLSRDALEGLVAAATDAAPLLPFEVDRLIERCDGSPLSCEELLRAVRETGIDELPESLNAAILADIDRLPPLSRRLLGFAAVLGRTFRLDALLEVLGAEARELDSGSLDALGDFLSPVDDGRITFRHALARDVVYETLSFSRRRELHERAGLALERMAQPDKNRYAELCSFHFLEARLWRSAWGYATLAGARAAAAYAPVEAAVHYERALTAARNIDDLGDERVADIWTSLGDAREIVGRFDAASDAYSHAQRLVGTDRRRAEVLLRRSRANERQGRYAAAVRFVRRAAKLLEGADDQEDVAVRARVVGWEASLRQAQGRHAEAVRLARTAIDDATASGERDALARAYMTLDWAYLDLGRPELMVHVEQALEIFIELDDLASQAIVLGNLGVEAQYDGRWRDAIAFYERAANAMERTGNVVQAAMARCNTAEVLVNQGRLDEAADLLVSVSRVCRAAGFTSGLAFATLLEGRVAAARDDFELAGELFDSAQQQFDSIGARGEGLEADVRRAELRLRQGRVEEALALADVALSVESALGGSATFTPALLRVRAAATALLSGPASAIRILDEARDVARAGGSVYEEALVEVLRDALNDRPAAAGATHLERLASLDVLRVPALLPG